MIALSSIGVIAIDQTAETESYQFESDAPNQTYEPDDTTTVEADIETQTSKVTKESDCEAKSRSVDTDNDNLNNFFECSHGLNETNPDTDGDTLTDAEEIHEVTENGAPIPDSNPREKDIYVVIGMSNGAQFDGERLASIFANLDVENHNGETGINLHYDKQQVNETVRIGNWTENEEKYKAKLTRNSEVYRGVLIATGDSAEYLGKARVYDNFAVSQSGYEKTATHEILHLIVGPIPENNCEDRFHNCHGKTLLSPVINSNDSLAQNTTTHIEEHGLGPRRTTHGILDDYN